MRAFGIPLALTLLVAPGAFAGDRWTQPFAGVRRLTRTTTSPPQRIHALFVDLDMPGVKLGVTPYPQRNRKVSSAGAVTGAQAAVNGDLFNTGTFVPNGLARSRGATWPGTHDDDWSATLQFNRALTRVELTAPGTRVTPEAWMWGVISGHPGLVRAGEVTERTGGICDPRNPRTGVALKENGRTAIIVVVDGRSAGATGMTCTEFARELRRLGAFQAVNLDGGGSSAIWLRGLGVVNRPSDGVERTVANHLLVFAPAVSKLGVLSGIVRDAGNGKALKGVKVQFQNGRSVVTRADGAFRFGIPAGTYRLTFTRAGFLTQTLRKKVIAKKRTAVALSLKRPPATPGTPFVDVAPGAPDTDGDGIDDALDVCPAVPDPAQIDTDADGQGDACDDDSDEDGVPDDDDLCPTVEDPSNADSDGDGLGDACDDEGGEAVADDAPCAAAECETLAAEGESATSEDEPISGEEGGCAAVPVSVLALACLFRRRSTCGASSL